MATQTITRNDLASQYEEEEERRRMESDFDRQEQDWQEAHWREEYYEDWYTEEERDRARELGLIVRTGIDLPTPIRLETIFQDHYSLTEDEWEDIWNRQSRPVQSLNPKIGDITTFTFKVNEETETKMKTEAFDCPICYTTVCKFDAIHLNCAHVFCGSCVSSHLDTLHQNHALLPSCALCRTEYTFFEIPNPVISDKIELVLRK